MTNTELKYEEALAQIEQILNKIRQGEISIDELSSQIKRATELIEFCRQRLYKCEEEVKNIIER